MSEHLGGTEYLAVKNCPLKILENIIKVTALLHDAGKLSQQFVAYMAEVLKSGQNVRKQHIDHSSAGGRIIETITGSCMLSEFVGTAIYSHHGLQDCIDMVTGETLSEKRGKKEIEFEEVKRRYFQIIDEDILREYLKAAHADMQKIYLQIKEFVDAGKEKKCGSKEFYFGMYERLLLSILIDSDWTDTACFARNEPLPERISQEKTQEIWNQCIVHFENYMKILKKSGEESPLNVYREKISERCYQASKAERRLYRLTVPTGAGKTLSSLRYALNHARKYHKKHIIYVAPYNSILEQNAEEIRKAVGSEKYVLEHHCDVSLENEEEEQEYRKLTENWDSPFIVTTAVQMLNTLFSGQKSSIRRMYNLCNSVIIFDEIQAFPISGTELFNLAVNFLSVFCNTTIVLCSATQPSLARLQENNLYDCIEMAGDTRTYAEAFKRVEIEDRTDLIPGGMSSEQLSDFVFEAFLKYRSVLIIVNTKSCAQRVYEILKERANDKFELHHLSTNMCPENRSEELRLIKEELCAEKPVICVSTQLVEAGVNLSFGCVIRSLAGLDSIIQAAGRCNRHKSQKLGKVYIIKMAQNEERLERLKDIRRARNASEYFLYYFKDNPSNFDDAMDSEASIKAYYGIYFGNASENVTKYQSHIQEVNLDELLGKNETGREQYKRYHKGKIRKSFLNQAFRTAGEDYEVIPEDEKVTVVVPYDQIAEEAIIVLEKKDTSLPEKKRALRKLQRYSVGISKQKKEELGNAIHRVEMSEIFVLSMDYYDKKKGVLDTPINRFLNF